MPTTVRDLITVLETFFPGAMLMQHALYVLMIVTSLTPLLRLHHHQRRQGHQPRETAWLKSIFIILVRAFQVEHEGAELYFHEDTLRGYAEDMYRDINTLYEFMGLDTAASSQNPLSSKVPKILCTSRLECIICPAGELHTLRRRDKMQMVRVLNSQYAWEEAKLFIAHCSSCRSDYYPDKITFRGLDNTRRQKLECDATHLQVSKHGVWVTREIAVAQEHALHRFHAGWSNFADWINDSLRMKPYITTRQSQRLFIEHFSRRLLVAHTRQLLFTSPAHPSSRQLAEMVRNEIGRDGGVLESSLNHGCLDCTHKKRYRADLIDEGAGFDNGMDDVAGLAENENLEDIPNTLNERGLPPGLPDYVPQQQPPPEDMPRGYVRMAVMDGKTIVHRKCAIDDCRNPLVNYKNGRFCEQHLDLRAICGIIPCGRPIRESGAMTCDNTLHIDWYKTYTARFTRLSYSGVKRVIRRQQQQAEPDGQTAHGPTLQIQFPPLEGIPGDKVTHTFRAQSTYCLQTIQWACGVPIGWGKCYKSESSPQVLSILDRIWNNNAALRPSFIAYDDACGLLRHIVTQDANSSWLETTKFVVDAWHYIGHRATDVLCRIWCNPAPSNGTQPDLVLVEEDDNGNKHVTRAFNTETAEQFNAWLNGFEAQLRQMSDVNYDFYIHVLFLLYREKVERRIEKKERHLPDEF